MPARFAFLDHDGPIAFAHRGGAAEAPENTATSFAHALSLGYQYLETDVRASADGVVVISHDPTLDRVSDRTGAVSELPWAEIARVRLVGDEVMPRLDEMLERWPEARWNIDAKDDAVIDPLVEVVRRAGAMDRVCLTSFFDHRIDRFRAALGPTLCTSMGRRSLSRLRVDTLLPGRRTYPAGAAQVPMRFGVIPVVEPRFLAGAHRAGVAVHVWTIDDEATIDRLLDLGVDGIMTDRPSVLRAVLRRRGQWL
jgi:glycerophosphoryl diester phosphodiesterase